jgi:hypothetical protein
MSKTWQNVAAAAGEGVGMLHTWQKVAAAAWEGVGYCIPGKNVATAAGEGVEILHTWRKRCHCRRGRCGDDAYLAKTLPLPRGKVLGCCIPGKNVATAAGEGVWMLLAEDMSHAGTGNDFQPAPALPHAKWYFCNKKQKIILFSSQSTSQVNLVTGFL